MGADTILVSSWEELSKARSDQFTLEVDEFAGSARILDLNGDVVFYLSTHSFYEHHINKSNEALRYFGFNVELVRDGDFDGEQ